MRCYDFEYDGILLSDMGYTLCTFGSANDETVSGSEITFNTISVLNGSKYELISSTYETCLESTFQICKTSCEENTLYITLEDYRKIAAWLNRRSFHKLKLIDENSEYTDIYYEASFNLSQIEFGSKIVGIELTAKTNRPYALHEPVTITITNTAAGGTAVITDESDAEGYIYPHVEISITEAGDLTIYNAAEARTTYIANCTAGEVITLDFPIISSSDSTHEIQNDFNWNFLRIANTYQNPENTLTISIPCIIQLEYSPAVKIGL